MNDHRYVKIDKTRVNIMQGSKNSNKVVLVTRASVLMVVKIFIVARVWVVWHHNMLRAKQLTHTLFSLIIVVHVCKLVAWVTSLVRNRIDLNRRLGSVHNSIESRWLLDQLLKSLLKSWHIVVQSLSSLLGLSSKLSCVPNLSLSWATVHSGSLKTRHGNRRIRVIDEESACGFQVIVSNSQCYLSIVAFVAHFLQSF